MPFCPKCKVEYREGFTFCSDCKIPLVKSLSERNLNDINKDSYNTGNYDLDDEIYNTSDEDINSVEVKLDRGIEEEIQEELDDRDSEISRTLSDEDKAKLSAEINKRRMMRSSKEYMSTEDKSKENLSSGIMLIVIGLIGVIFIILLLIGIFPFKPRGVVSIIIDCILLLFFASFVYFGISSILKYKSLKTYASVEKNENEKFVNWFDKTINKGFIDGDIDISDDEQMNYFKRNAKIKYISMHQFPNIDEDFIDSVIDEKYEDIFG